MAKLIIGGCIALVVGVILYATGNEKMGIVFIAAGSVATGIVLLFLVLAVLVLLTNYDTYLEE